MEKQTVEIIMFVLAGCGFCVKAQKILESEIKEGKVEIRPHTAAKGLKWARGFPCLVRLKDGKGVLGCPINFKDLMEKLNKSDITVEKMELSKFNKIKLPPKMKAVQRKSITPMKNKEIKHKSNHDKKDVYKEPLKPIFKKKDMASPPPPASFARPIGLIDDPKPSKEGFMKIGIESAGSLNKIMFYNMSTCPYCKQAQTMLDAEIRKGEIVVIPHTEAPKHVKGFPYFSWNKKEEYGLPKSAKALFEKLGYKFENFIIRQEEKTVRIAQEEDEIKPEESKEFYTSYENMKFESYTKRPPTHHLRETEKRFLGVF